MSSNEDNELLGAFIEESVEHLADIEGDLLAIEQGGAVNNEERVNKVFRAIHSIKGGAGFMGLHVLQDLAHAAENVLGLMRTRKLTPTQEVINGLLLATDRLKQHLANISCSNEIDISAPVAILNAIAAGDQPAATSPPEVRPAAPEAMAPLSTEGDIPPPDDGMATSKTETSIRVSVSLLDQLMTLAGELVLSRNQLLQTIGSGAAPEAEAVGQRIDLVTSELQGAIMLTRMQPIGNVLGKFPRVVRDLAKKLGKEVELHLVGKEVELDKTIIEAISDPLTHLVRNSIDHGIESPGERQGLGKPSHGTLLLKAYHAAGQVVIEIKDDGRGLDGEQLAATAMAKGLISADQAKLMSAKEKLNLILLPGFSTAALVTDVSGRGVGMDVVKTNLDQLGGTLEIDSVVGQGTRIAIKLPLTLAIIPSQIIMTGEERYAIPQANLEELLRIPAAQIKERIERVGDAEVVRLRGTLLPLIRLSDTLGIERTYYDEETGTTRSDRRHNIADRRSRTSPLFDPAAIVVREPETTPEPRGTDRRQSPSSALNIVVVTTGAFRYGLIVDRLLDSEEIVIKPLGRHLQGCQGYAGATIMGDGRIALILDIADLARMARLTSLEGSRRSGELARETLLKRQDRQALLTFRSAQEEQFAVPLSLVERVEKINRSQIEAIGSRRVMQYRGGSLPLLSVDEVATVLPLADQDNLLVIVFRLKGKDIGLLASGPVDAIEVSAEIDAVTLRQTGIMGSAIIGGTTTMLVDIFELVETLHPDWFGDAAACGGEDVDQVLIVDDSEFFRNLVRSYLEQAGFPVVEAVDGLDAWQVLESNHETIGLVVTDIEMPNLDGFELTQRIKHSSRFAHLPVIALTTLAAEEDIARGKAAGVEEYHIKLDRERLVEGVCRCLRTTVAA
ncbi:CheA signal transduction histidine kinase [Desulfobulbus propionicus DSM 2032]|uniref:histidine kinase n=1 Tax=Desulfobulbus propionicus (strain ATCC 33891 / DSM 2032 / VKM B-1956 / 1pr3) TaxID=577650 RepID=A0A7U3YN33_DESPD|nr:chemotaxis protein CheW [Desulfobulbus propionicus]ADW18423.1 CheA signal transduction histidine kinase [Desulfobulbus propionicus DSM 2032]